MKKEHKKALLKVITERTKEYTKLNYPSEVNSSFKPTKKQAAIIAACKDKFGCNQRSVAGLISILSDIPAEFLCAPQAGSELRVVGLACFIALKGQGSSSTPGYGTPLLMRSLRQATNHLGAYTTFPSGYVKNNRPATTKEISQLTDAQLEKAAENLVFVC